MESECPFCPYSDSDCRYVVEHVEICHPEFGDSPFIVKSEEQTPLPIVEQDEGPGQALDVPSAEEYVECECGEMVMLSEFTSHIALHDMEETTADLSTPDILRPSTSPHPAGTDLSLNSTLEASSHVYEPSNNGSSSKHRSRAGHHKNHHGVQNFMGALLGSSSSHSRSKVPKTRQKAPRRLGRAELGPHAHEEQMPSWLRKQLEIGAKVKYINQIHADGHLSRVETVANEISGTVPVLAQLCEQDRALSKAYLCHPEVQHVVKMAKEGGFCGYRNIQMMISYIRGASSQGYHYFPERIPSILALQDSIESAWDKGINESGRIETGGIRGTRKYIGTPEAQALLISYDIGCETNAFSETSSNLGYRQVLLAVEEYFLAGVTNTTSKVCRTSMPPIYFQHPGHSMTIVGLEKRKSGSSNLLVLDPMFKPSPGIMRLLGTQFRTENPEKLLKAYRRGDLYLGKYKNFEILKLTWRVPTKERWNEL